ncbi:enoyl-CoA hydratase [Dietzia aerolata]|uniref:Enoyl-CoA hydratase n=1 Tax=Dietzia aerolata TaxID=595984 RepID=A0ABV5JPS1_9ACTN|nr:enoyl-CoA hydratase [Dietzia aerolata]MBB0968509.1 enoyl-CoA hydratase [Dietzia aerolata]NLD85184.1 enoyl-CoA hydratase [Actinomycetales bacterium]HIW66551.1 enoyl-CoA hydratase [Candidatus Dietzia merdigallinarum]
MTVTGIDALKVEVTELGVVTISINRPDRLNALDAPTVTALIEQITTHGADPATRVLVLAGEGAAFTTGADLQAMAEAGDDAPTPDQTMDSAAALVRAVLTAPVPVIAAVNGPAAGVGVSLALASDLVFMAEDAYLLFAFTNIGLMPDGGASVLLPAQVGRAVASRMLLRGDAVPAAEAKQVGLAIDVFPVDELREAADKLARRLARGPRRALELTKKSVTAATLAELDAALAREHEGQAELLTSADFAEGVASMLDKRRPTFS